MKIVDDKGNEVECRVVYSRGFEIERDGTVHLFDEPHEGERTEWTERFHESPVRHVYAPWLQELMGLPAENTGAA